MRTVSPACHSTGPFANLPSRIFGPLQVREDCDRAADGIGCVAHRAVHALVVGLVPVTEVEPRDIHAGEPAGHAADIPMHRYTLRNERKWRMAVRASMIVVAKAKKPC